MVIILTGNITGFLIQVVTLTTAVDNNGDCDDNSSSSVFPS